MFTIYECRRILTMNPSQPFATHVAVREGRILGAGTLEELQGWGEHVLDRQFAELVLMPGFVEGHCHVAEGSFWRAVYCGYFDRMDPDGRVWPGLHTIDAVLQRLREAQALQPDATEPLSGWSLDPIHLPGGQRVTRQHLDEVSRTRPVGVLHASGHILCVNSCTLERAGLLRPGVDHPGIPLGEDGLPLGELRGPDPMALAGPHVGFEGMMQAGDEAGLRRFARLCVRQGVTTATDLASLLPDDAVAMLQRVTAEPDFPVRLVALRRFVGLTPAQLIERALVLRARSTERLRLGGVKLFADGSIQGYTARLRWPGYVNGAPNGLWYIDPEQLQDVLVRALQHGVMVHVHNNGDEATDLVLDAVQRALQAQPRPDHRITLQHTQLADAAQFRRMKALGLCVNLFPNHLWYWGDAHHDLTVGPQRAQHMNACATALATGVPMAIHSDAPVTPLGPLFTAWCAVNRLTPRGRVLGPAERIGVAEALHTITLGAAYTLGLDAEVGSIECGKRADFAVLEKDPTEVAPERLKDVRIWGTVQDGRPFPAAVA